MALRALDNGKSDALQTGSQVRVAAVGVATGKSSGAAQIAGLLLGTVIEIIIIGIQVNTCGSWIVVASINGNPD